MDELDDLRRRVDTLEERNRLALLMAWAGIVLTSSQAQTRTPR